MLDLSSVVDSAKDADQKKEGKKRDCYLPILRNHRRFNHMRNWIGSGLDLLAYTEAVFSRSLLFGCWHSKLP